MKQSWLRCSAYFKRNTNFSEAACHPQHKPWQVTGMYTAMDHTRRLYAAVHLYVLSAIVSVCRRGHKTVYSWLARLALLRLRQTKCFGGCRQRPGRGHPRLPSGVSCVEYTELVFLLKTARWDAFHKDTTIIVRFNGGTVNVTKKKIQRT